MTRHSILVATLPPKKHVKLTLAQNSCCLAWIFSDLADFAEVLSSAPKHKTPPTYQATTVAQQGAADHGYRGNAQGDAHFPI